MRLFFFRLFLLTAILLSCLPGFLWGQFQLADIPTSSEEASRMVKNVDEQTIPSNQPGLVYEEIRVARQKVEEYTNARDRTIPQSLALLDPAKANMQQALSHLQQLAKECSKQGNPTELKQAIQEFNNPFSAITSVDAPTLFSSLRHFSLLSSGDLCKTLASDQTIASLKANYETDIEKVRDLENQQRSFVEQLQKAWSGRLAKLEKIQSEQAQTYDLQKKFFLTW